ncbi:acyltransferase family protein [Segniliparus rotundus]|uniref:acyltransferase family protein n=1 Tax=Segniliparus rotundus TaxID=286802 RepID=UPI0006744912|nr:acyltransferase [Segniliparus rotundus]
MIDLLRILSLSVVVAGHLLLVVLYFDASCPEPRQCVRAAGALDNSAALQWATWGLQIMPLFFFAGGAANVGSWHEGASWGGWLFARCQRLYRPALWFVAAIVLLLLVCERFVPSDALAIATPQVFVLLWFLGVYTVCLAFVPLLAKIATGRQLALVVAVLFGLAALIDQARRTWGSDWRVGAANFLFVWLIPTAIGAGYRRGLVARPVGAAMFAGALALDLSLCLLGPYAVSMLSTADSDRISNFTPPSMLLAGHSVCLCGLVVLVAPQLRAFASRPQVWRFVTVGNSGAMTLYLWHWAALFGMDGALIVAGLLPVSNASPGLWPSKAQQAPLFLFLVFAAFLLLRPLETKPLPWWDDSVTARGWRNPVVGALLLCAGASTLVLARLGPQAVGLWGTAALAVFLVAARASATTVISEASASEASASEASASEAFVSEASRKSPEQAPETS